MRRYPEYFPNSCPHDVIDMKYNKIMDGMEYWCISCGEACGNTFKREGELVQGKPMRLSWEDKSNLK